MFWIFSEISFGIGSAETGSFNEYINSPQGAGENLTGKNSNPVQAVNEAKTTNEAPQVDSQGMPASWQTCAETGNCAAAIAESPSWDFVAASVEKPVDKNIQSTPTDSQPVSQGVPARWQACAKDNDCTAVVVDCVSWEPLNKKYLPKFFKDLNSCLASIDPGFQPQVLCVDRACKTTGKTTHVSWEEWLNEMRNYQ
ncbi:MAG: hypothetical protein HQL14_05865 [Candidatus Omnitrophica bacterium]|nr:hypothetical protein [Candidatus Omnitrophota bacterium]